MPEAPAEPPTPPKSIPPPPGRIAVVVNGNAKNVTADVIATLDEILEGGDLFVSRRLEEGPEIARMLLNRGYGTVLTGGGDGTFTALVTQVIHESRNLGRPLPRFGFLKLGTGNALAWVVGASGGKRKGLSVDLKRLREDAGSRPIRLVEVEGVFAPFCGCGADAVVLNDYDQVKQALQKTPLRRYAAGPLSYAISTVTRSLPSYLFRPVPHCRVVNDGADAYRVGPRGIRIGAPVKRGETIYEGPARVAALSTIPYVGYGFRAFPYSDEADDRMCLRVSTISPVPFVMNFRSIWRGEYDNTNYMFDYVVEAVTMECDPPAPFQIGGDAKGERSRVEARVSDEPIRLVDFYAPPSAT